MDWNPKPLDPADITVHRRGRGKPLVLLHCLGMDWHFWDVLDPLADRFELIAYSFPGHHDSKLPAGQYGEAELSEQLHGLLKREGIAKASLAGISMGGSLAQHFAGTYPERVDRVILCDCSPRYNDEQRANWPVRAGLARKNGVASLIPMLEKVFFTQPSLDENGPNVRHVKEKWASCSGEGYALGCEWLAMLDAREQAKRMTMPTLILLGSNEGQPFKDAARWMADNIPGSKGVVEVPNAGHASVRERPEFVIGKFREFLG
ncbi:MAG: alpha/beta fold hydrolase [Alphaproteobacteria bacterium]|nr:alpha/beta fold hydrolase [Alphaproteobacteria bacterium]MBV8410680.1 alpha/beta fold hydrolase [Alphaproteobacteria bacterium]